MSSGSLSRRGFLKGVMGAAAALVVAPTVLENAEETRRFWSLDPVKPAQPRVVVSIDPGMPDGIIDYAWRLEDVKGPEWIVGQTFDAQTLQTMMRAELISQREARLKLFADWVESLDPMVYPKLPPMRFEKGYGYVFTPEQAGVLEGSHGHRGGRPGGDAGGHFGAGGAFDGEWATVLVPGPENERAGA